jgi:hypothetical protein
MRKFHLGNALFGGEGITGVAYKQSRSVVNKE